MSVKRSSFFCIALFFTHLSCKNCDNTIVFPDLIYTDVNIASDSLLNGVRVTTTIKNDAPINNCDANKGQSIATTQCISVFYKNATDSIPKIVATLKSPLPALTAGESTTQTDYLTIQAMGTYSFEFEVDCDNTVKESNELNNKWHT